jgi:hypothetical protein
MSAKKVDKYKTTSVSRLDMLKYLLSMPEYKKIKYDLIWSFAFNKNKLEKLYIAERRLDREVNELVKVFRKNNPKVV